MISSESLNYIAPYLTFDCTLKCGYCHPAGTPILMADMSWKKIEDINVGETVIGFGHEEAGRWLKFIEAKVINASRRLTSTVDVKTTRNVITCTADHQWFTGRGYRKPKVGTKMRWLSEPIIVNWSKEYAFGWLQGMAHGDGMFHEGIQITYNKGTNTYRQFRLAVEDYEIIERFKEYCELFAITFTESIFKYRYKGQKKELPAIYISNRDGFELLYNLPAIKDCNDDYRRGFLAGIYDAEGHVNGQTIRISQKDGRILARVADFMRQFGFDFNIKRHASSGVLTLTMTNCSQTMKFIAMTRPVLKRKYVRWPQKQGIPVEKILSVNPNTLEQPVYNIETSTGNYVANGYLSKNCIMRFDKFRSAEKSLTGDEWIEAFDKIPATQELPITVQGGEPTLHPDFYKIIQSNTGPFDLLTNGLFNAEEFTDKLKPEYFRIATFKAFFASIRISYHCRKWDMDNQEAYEQRLLHNMQLLRQAGFLASFTCPNHPDYQDKIAAFENQARKQNVPFQRKEFLGWHKGKFYGTMRYPSGTSGKAQKCQCRSTELLIRPEGTVFKCHRDLYANEYPIGHILNENFDYERKWRDCESFGNCNACDCKEKGDRYGNPGFCAIEVRGVKRDYKPGYIATESTCSMSLGG